eukprot:9525474-Karenia_brevis.AAC.1
MVDVTIRIPHADRYPNAHLASGVAAKAGEQDKLERYGKTVLLLSFEPYGRLGRESIKSLRHWHTRRRLSATMPLVGHLP